MFVVCFGDGLGNQMFQYAFYKSLIKRYPDTIVKMDIFHIYGPKMHNGFELNKIFGIKKNECCRTDALILAENWPIYKKKYILINLLHKVRRALIGKKESYILQEEPTTYYDELYHLNQLHSYMFRGNWINERYFKAFRNELIFDFKFPDIIGAKNLEYVEKIRNTNSVSIHVRRGDYLKLDMYKLGNNYFEKAINYISVKVEEPTFYIFTDDKDYVADLLSDLKQKVIINCNYGDKSYIDMQLMSMCKHNIIANSTFSFWGAYLNTNKEKIVIAPNKVAPDVRNPFACDGWHLIDVEREYE